MKNISLVEMLQSHFREHLTHSRFSVRPIIPDDVHKVNWNWEEHNSNLCTVPDLVVIAITGIVSRDYVMATVLHKNTIIAILSSYQGNPDILLFGPNESFQVRVEKSNDTTGQLVFAFTGLATEPEGRRILYGGVG